MRADTVPLLAVLSVSMPCWVRTAPGPSTCHRRWLSGPTKVSSYTRPPWPYQPKVLPAWTGPGAPCVWLAAAGPEAGASEAARATATRAAEPRRGRVRSRLNMAFEPSECPRNGRFGVVTSRRLCHSGGVAERDDGIDFALA